jgi:alkylhydroperoxidase family enzyme
MFDGDISDLGYVMNLSRVWAYGPAIHDGISELLSEVATAHGLTFRQRGILVTACAATLGDSYCALAWGGKLAGEADPETAAGVLRGDDGDLTAAERAMAGWARKVAGDPSRTSQADVQVLRDAGWTDEQIFGITAFVALRVAFSTVNDALGVSPDAAYRSTVPKPVLDAVTFGRPIEST